MKAIGFLGGTFDPVHHGHLRLAIEIREAADLAEVRLLPARIPNLRESPGASAQARLAMLDIAIAGTGLGVDPRELAGTGVTYTVETLASLRVELGARPLAFILGQDAFNSLPRWHRWRELLDFAHLVVATRPGHAPPESPELAALLAGHAVTSREALAARPAGGILLQPIPLLPISATDLRARVRAGRNITGLTPAGVADYITRHQLYGG
ncbi:MAG: nicotinate-nucleotide adenylyltransferase [Gammaproteobacteria bacterium]